MCDDFENSDTENLENNSEEVEVFQADYTEPTDRERYENLIDRLIEYLRIDGNRIQGMIIRIRENKDGSTRITHMNSRSLYLDSVIIDELVPINRINHLHLFFI